jgi:Fic family protein
MLFTSPDLEPLDTEVIEGVLELRRSLRHGLAVRRQWVGVLRRVTLAQAIRSSNSIEGYRVSAEDAMAAVEHTDPLEAAEDAEAAVAWEATIAYRRAVTYVLNLHDDPHFAFDPVLLKSLHFMLVEYDLDAMPGRWRPGPVFVNDTATGGIVYEGPEADLVPGLIGELVDVLASGDEPAMVRGAMAHLNLAMIHPFKDGNGRMARVMQSLVLAREGILAPEFCSIEEYLGRFTRDYYDVLASVGGGHWQPERDARAWLRFCLTAHYRQARVLLRRIDEAARLYEAIDERLDAHGLPDRAAAPLFLAAGGYRITNESYRTTADVSGNTATRDLRALLDAGLLAAHGEKRGRHYTASADLADLGRHAAAGLRTAERVDPYRDPLLMGDPYAQPSLLDG